MKFIIRILVSTLAVLATSYLLPESMISVADFKTCLVVALVLAFLNSVIKPIMIILTIPATILSFGLFLLVINAAIIMIADYFVDGFKVHGFWSALLFAVILAIVNSVFERLQKKDEQQN
ncbi:MAG: hypothetical protein FD123_1411 [Bacteroidetes bacterium]|nr:MAG: hypothetical protein FD123_1411 [Bacteroidota bacterium]